MSRAQARAAAARIPELEARRICWAVHQLTVHLAMHARGECTCHRTPDGTITRPSRICAIHTNPQPPLDIHPEPQEAA